MGVKPIRVAVLFGGRSTEHEISIITGLQLANAMDVRKYVPVPVYVSESGRWYHGECLNVKEFYKSKANRARIGSYADEVTLLPRPGTNGLLVLKEHNGRRPLSMDPDSGRTIPVDVYLPAFHGAFGEDGCIQGLFELAGVPYTGCDVPSSALGMNKLLTKQLAAMNGIPVVPGIPVYREEAQKGMTAVLDRIEAEGTLGSYPFFVKPCNLGSSIGIALAGDRAFLAKALANALEYDSVALVEQAVLSPLEINVSVQGHPSVCASVVEIPVSSTGTSLSFEDKYLTGGGDKTSSSSGASQGMAGLTRVIDPKDLSLDMKKRTRDLAVAVYKTLGCAGVVRIDFLVDSSTDTVYFNEINTIPGSFAFYLWNKSVPPVLYPELIDGLIAEAFLRQSLRASVKRECKFRAI